MADVQCLGEEDMKCSIGGCEKEAAGRGWCHAHYKKWQVYGDPMFRKRLSQFASQLILGIILWWGGFWEPLFK